MYPGKKKFYKRFNKDSKYVSTPALAAWIRFNTTGLEIVQVGKSLRVKENGENVIEPLDTKFPDRCSTDDLVALAHMSCYTIKKPRTEEIATLITAFVSITAAALGTIVLWDIPKLLDGISGNHFTIDLDHMESLRGPSGTPIKKVPLKYDGKEVMMLLCTGELPKVIVQRYRLIESLLTSKLDQDTILRYVKSKEVS